VATHEVPARFAVAFSLAGEQREQALPIAQEVEAILGRSSVFYDNWYEHWIAGTNADLLLQDLYANKADLVVVFISGDYGEKSWTKTEHSAIRAMLMNDPSRRNHVLPLRLGDGQVEGVLGNEIVPDVRGRPASAVADLVISRLKLARELEVGAAPSISWPAEAPDLSWPMADHEEARHVFAQLLRETASNRILLVRGPSETGKTHMSKQMARNCVMLPNVACGRFDFKGTTTMDIELEAFAQPLRIEPPDGGTLNERLGKLFTQLRRRAEPTILIFDTYEAAGQAQDYIEQVLLPLVVSASWLRVVVIGQTVPFRVGTAWESLAGTPLKLQVPTPEQWLKFGMANRSEPLDLELVTRIYGLSEGRASILAGMLGPSA